MKTLKELASNIRTQLKREFPDCTFSVVKSEASMCGEVDISLMKAPFNAIEKNEHWSDYAQLNEYQLRNPYRETTMCNGALLTQQAWDTMKRVVEIADATGEFDTQFTFLSVNIGKWDKPFQRS
jgi:hypothetical protein